MDFVNLWITSVLIGVCLSFSQSSNQDLSLNQIPDEFFEAWQNVEKRMVKAVKIRLQEKLDGNLLDAEATFGFSRGHGVHVEHRKFENGLRSNASLEIKALNPAYSFWLTKPPNGKWVLVELDRSDIRKRHADYYGKLISKDKDDIPNEYAVHPAILAATRVEIGSIEFGWDELFRQPGIRIQSVSIDTADEDKTLTIDFDGSMEIQMGKRLIKCGISVGHAVFSYKHNFLPMNAHISLHFEDWHTVNGKISIINKEFFHRRTVPFPGKHEMIAEGVLSDGREVRFERIMEFDLENVGEDGPVGFFLSDFGLPEPDWYRPPPPYWLYVSITGMVLLVIGALLMRYGKSLWRRG